MRRLAVLACALALVLIAAAPASAGNGSMVPGENQLERVGGQRILFGTHGDRIARGSDVRLRRAHKRLPRFAAKLPVTWCGTERSNDDTTNASFSGPRFKVAYVYAADQPNRFTTYRDLIQDDVSTVREWVIAASGGVKSIRFDTGTHCGPEYVDIVVIRLPQARATYLADPDRAEHVFQHVNQRLAMVGQWNTLIYAEGLYANDGVTGSGLLTMDDRPGAINQSNIGGAAAMIWGHGGPGFSYERQTTVLHEMTHNLGAVQDSAPHATGAGHCFELHDVMCYDDGGPSSFPIVNCAETFPLAYECNGDDYFNPAPASGTYLDNNWNVYDSVFLCPVASCLTASGGGTTQPAPVGPPPSPTTPTPTTPTDPGPAPDPGGAVSDGAEQWLDVFMADAAARVKKVGLRGLAKGQAIALRGTAPNGYSVQVDLMWGAAAIAGGGLDASGVARLKVPRTHRRLLAKKRKVRLIVQGVIRGAAGGGPPSLKKVAVTLKAPAKKKRSRRR